MVIVVVHRSTMDRGPWRAARLTRVRLHCRLFARMLATGVLGGRGRPWEAHWRRDLTAAGGIKGNWQAVNNNRVHQTLSRAVF
jgi:hypothetical protein